MTVDESELLESVGYNSQIGRPSMEAGVKQSKAKEDIVVRVQSAILY